MSITHGNPGFGARPFADGPGSRASSGGRPSLGAAATGALGGIRPRIVSVGGLAAFGRLGDLALLVLISLAVFRVYVAPTDGFATRYFLAAAVLPIATVLLIGSFRGYTIAAYRRLLPEIA